MASRLPRSGTIHRRDFLAASGALTGQALLLSNCIDPASLQATERIHDEEVSTIALLPNAYVPYWCRVPHVAIPRRVATNWEEVLKKQRFRIRRGGDLLNVVIELRGGTLWRYYREELFLVTDDHVPAKLLVHFPPQHVGEDFVASTDLGCGKLPAPVDHWLKSCLSEESMLVFEIPAKSRLWLRLDDLLNWKALKPLLAAAAVPNIGLVRPDDGTSIGVPSPLKPRPVKDDETQIILPGGLILSPHEFIHWDHNTQLPTPTVDSTRNVQKRTVEVWESRAYVDPKFIKSNTGRSLDELSTVRAVWDKDTAADSSTNGSLPSRRDRHQIVALNAGFNLTYQPFGEPATPYIPAPLNFTDLRLSTLGGSLDVKGQWLPQNVKGFEGLLGDPSPALSITKYQHQIKQGRDQFVQVEKIFLACPTPSVVILIQERLRRFIPMNIDGKEGVGAIVVERWFTKHIPLAEFDLTPDGTNEIGRRWPFRKVEFKWPDKVELQQPYDIVTEAPSDDPAACWMIPKCGTEPLPIEFTTTDRQNNIQRFNSPLLLIAYDLATNPDKDAQLRAILNKYLKTPPAPGGPAADPYRYRNVNLAGQKLGLVPAKPGQRPDDPNNRGAFVTQRIRFGIEMEDSAWTDFPPIPLDPVVCPPPAKIPSKWRFARYYPSVTQLTIRLRDVEAYSSGSAPIATEVGWNSLFNAVGFNEQSPDVAAKAKNVGEVFLDVSPTPEDAAHASPRLNFAADKGGGLATPTIEVKSLSRKIGPVGGTTSRVALAGAGGPVNSLINGQFDPLSFFPTDAKLIGDITLSQLLALIPDIGEDLAKIPTLLSQEFADVKAGLEQVRDLLKLIDTVRKVIDAFPAGLSTTIAQLNQTILGRLQSEIIDALKPVTKDVIEFLTLAVDTTEGISIPGTFAIIKDSIKAHYAATDDDYLALYQAFNVDRLIRALPGAASAAAEELMRFSPVDVLAPLQKVRDLANVISNPDKLLDGSFMDQVDAAIQALGLGPGGLLGAVQSQVKLFATRLQTAVDNAVQQVQKEAVTVITAVTDLLNTKYPVAVSPVSSPDSALRLAAFQDYIDGLITKRWESAINQVQETGGRYLLEQLTDPVLADLLGKIDSAFAGVASAVQSVRNTIADAVAKIPKTLSVAYDWETELHTGPSDFPIFVAHSRDGSRKAKLVFHTRIEKKLGFSQASLASPPIFDASLSLTDFQIVLIPSLEFVIIGFKTLKLETHGLEAPKVTTELQGVEFGDALAFIQQIASLFSPKSGFYANVDFRGIAAGYHIGIPDFSVGAFNLADLSIGVGFNLPFDGKPIELALNVSERHRPCLLSAGIYGGTAFFGLRISPRGNASSGSVRLLETALEFGAVVNASIGPAKGRLFVFGGFYFGQQGDMVTFTAFVHAGGSLDLLGLITISADFYVALTYQRIGQDTQVFGEAQLSVHVKIIFVINISVTLYYRKQFEGSPQPTNSHDHVQHDVHRPFMFCGDRRVLGAQSVSAAVSPKSTLQRHVPIVTDEWVRYCRLFA
jgi:hypothetical protein